MGNRFFNIPMREFARNDRFGFQRRLRLPASLRKPSK
jgi:hypothetical protein